MYTSHLISYIYTVIYCIYNSIILYLHTYIHILEVIMYMITLLIVIASLTLVECYSAKSEIKFGYGLLYEHRGQLLLGLNKYHLLVGVEMPKFTFTQYSYQLEQHLNCGHFINMAVLHNVCYSLVLLCINYRTKELQYQNEISQILESYLLAYHANI